MNQQKIAAIVVFIWSMLTIGHSIKYLLSLIIGKKCRIFIRDEYNFVLLCSMITSACYLLIIASHQISLVYYIAPLIYLGLFICWKVQTRLLIKHRIATYYVFAALIISSTIAFSSMDCIVASHCRWNWLGSEPNNQMREIGV